jgi:SAM-dependent methyltransferase
MAISATHYHLLCSLRDKLPHGGTLLEIGEANWYGDIQPDFPYQPGSNLFEIAKACYASLFAPERTVAIDKDGTPAALRHDLNQPFDLGEQFDVVINHGTAEHIFNVAQVFRSMHDHCQPGGLMIHESPFTGWIDHGFYCLQPTLFYDLAAANCYEIVLVAVEDFAAKSYQRLTTRDHAVELAAAGELPPNGTLFVVFRKLFDMEFRVPCQGYYAGTLSHKGSKAWEVLR